MAAGREIDIDTICDIALEIEPSDGIFLPGITLIDHVSGSIRRTLGHPPAIHIAIFDVGGEVDTIDFNHRSDLAELNRAKEPQVLKALQMVETGLLKGDCSLIGEGATLSALANQSILFKPSLEGIIELAVSFGAVGVNVAHSGTVIGVMFDPSIDSLVIDDCIRQFAEVLMRFANCGQPANERRTVDCEAPEYVGNAIVLTAEIDTPLPETAG